MAGFPTPLRGSGREAAVRSMNVVDLAQGAEPVTKTPEVASAIRPDYPEPLWIQAVNLIAEEIAAGVLRAGTRLPPERELCLQLGISRVTLRKALTKLVDDGALRPTHGRGWYVAQTAAAKEWPNSLESFSETAKRMGLEATSTVLHAEERNATLDEAELLLIAPGTPIFRLERVRLLGGMPIALDSTKLALQLVPDIGTVDFAGASLYEELAKRDILPARADAVIEAQEADTELARLLDLAAGKPLLVMRQVALDQSGHPLFASMIQYAGDRYRLRTSFARSGSASPGR
jgi:DNA-binding GntR family transcriptional regulator